MGHVCYGYIPIIVWHVRWGARGVGAVTGGGKLPLQLPLVERIELALDHIRPALRADGGDVRTVRFDEGRGLLVVQLEGACATCHNRRLARKMGIEPILRAQVPEVKEVALAAEAGAD